MAITSDASGGGGGGGKGGGGLIAARVVDIILDIDDVRAQNLGGWDALGTIFYSKIKSSRGSAATSPQDLLTAKPLFSNHKYYPLKG